MATISRVLPLVLSGFCIGASVNVCSAAPDDVSPRPTTWFSITGSGTNSIADLATDADGNLYIAGTTTSPDLPVKNAAQAEFAEAQVMRSTDRGATWTKAGNPAITNSTRTDSPAVIAADPSNSGVLFIGAPEGIFKTTDGGQSWRKVAQTPTLAIAIDAGNPARMLAGGGAGIFASMDGGENWAVSLAGYGTTSFVLDPLGSGTVLAFSGSVSVLISKDMGRTWTPLPAPRLSTHAAFDPFRAGWIYMEAYATVSEPGVLGHTYLSTDGGATWTEKAQPPFGVGNLLADPEQPNVLFGASRYSGVFRSDDGGSSWQLLSMQRAPGLAILPQGCGGILVAYDGESNGSVSFDRGANWQAVPINRVRSIATGPGCTVYVLRSIVSDAFAAKVSPDGTQILWATYLGGSGDDLARAIAVDSAGNVYVAGNTQSLDFPLPGSRLGERGDSDAFVTKLDRDGKLVYATVFGGSGREEVRALAVDSAGNAHVVGSTISMNLPVTEGAFQTEPGILPNSFGVGFVAKFDPSGAPVYVSYVGSAEASAVAVDPQGQALVAGIGGYLVRINPSGTAITYNTYLGGKPEPRISLQGPDAPRGSGAFTMKVDAQGNVYLAGNTALPDFPVTAGAYQSGLHAQGCGRTFGSSSPFYFPGETFVMKLRAGDLQPIYSALLGAECWAQPQNLLIGADGSVIITVSTVASAFPLRNPLPREACNGARSGVLFRLSADGSTLLFSTYLCISPGADLAPDGSVYVTAATARSEVLRVPIPSAPTFSLDQVANAFDGSPFSISPLAFLRLSGKLGPLPRCRWFSRATLRTL